MPPDPCIVLTMNDLWINHCRIVEGLGDHSPLCIYIRPCGHIVGLDQNVWSRTSYLQGVRWTALSSNTLMWSWRCPGVAERAVPDPGTIPWPSCPYMLASIVIVMVVQGNVGHPCDRQCLSGHPGNEPQPVGCECLAASGITGCNACGGGHVPLTAV